MNNVKFRPVGQPNAPIEEIKISQCKAAHYTKNKKARALSLAQAHKLAGYHGLIRVTR